MISIKKIIVPTDFSNASVPAIAYAISLAKNHGAEVGVLHTFPTVAMREHYSQPLLTEGAVSPTGVPLGVSRQPDLDNILETKKQLLYSFLRENIGPELLKAVKINALVRFGKIVDEIVAAAKEEQSDLIVMTSHGSGLRRLFGGGYTEWIVRHAPCPVLAIQPSAEVRTEKDERVPVMLMEKWAA
jgi:universal stress protein A